MSKLVGVIVGLAFAIPSLAQAAKLVPVSKQTRAAVVRAVNTSIRNEGGKNARGMRVIINDQGHGLAFNKRSVSSAEIAGPYSFTIKGNKVSYPEHLYMAKLAALKGNF